MNPWNLKAYEAFFVDVDGVLVHDSQPIEGAADALCTLQDVGHVLILTNNSTRSRDQHAEHLCSLGFNIQPSDVVCSSFVVAETLRNEVGATVVWPVGESGLTEELLASGHRIASKPEQARWVVVGMDRTIDYQKLASALSALSAGAQLAATNQDGTYPTPKGPMPGAGAIVGALRGMGFEPDFTIGKPESPAFDVAKAKVSTDKILMIGDRLGTDILGGSRNDIDTLFVLSGISDESEIESSGIRPTWIAPSLASLLTGEVARS